MTAPALFSLVPMLTDDQELDTPDNGPYYVATKHGFMIHKRTHWGTVLVPVDEIPSLGSSQSMLYHDIKLPPELIGQAWSFFRGVWNERKSEAMVDITWDVERGYRLFVPPQKASGGGVHANRNPEHYRGQIVGTIHSHCNFGAFHSGTDDNDANGQDGLHITIGHVDSDNLDIAIMVSANTIKWKLELADITEGEVKLAPHPAWWQKLVADPAPHNTGHISTWKATPTVGAIVPFTQKPLNPVERTPSWVADKPFSKWMNIDETIDQLSPLDPRVDALEAIYDDIRVIEDELDQLGFELDYGISPASTLPQLPARSLTADATDAELIAYFGEPF